ncbi:CRC domain-containing protein [Artemisia annua]|uniref:CRC domain-containing protein n=1 Tax=Artemisia annua TaxID=35608 RepID=A0A2U1P7P0_ARTAN|nr:CRC domain-containing protein [Artemisia annua]
MDDGQKRCRCKKSNCLKLYCDCFKDGYYCAAELCSCEKCFNGLDYEDSVELAREEIELHDPHAFSSKICSQKQSTTSHNVEGENQQIAIELKHRKGCNCKKSMCSKNYCECYQARVGCGSECRCERCENAFGKKGASREGECHYPQFQLSSHGEGASMTSTFTSSGNSDMVFLGQQAYHNAEFMSQFTPSNNTMLEPSEMWELANRSRINENIMSVDSVHWPSSLLTTLPQFGGTKVSDFDGTPSGSYIHYPNTQATMSSPVDNQFQRCTTLEPSEMWELANRPRINENIMSTDSVHWPSSLLTTLPQFGGTKVSDFDGTPSGSYIHYPNTQAAMSCSRINENIMSVDSVHWPSSPLTTLPQFGGTKVSDYDGTPSGSYIHYPNTQAAMSSPVDKMDSNTKSDDQKRCRCKKSKCLKLYCWCFKAGLYCAELCSCQECCNSLDYKDTVDEARKRIQSQDPLAFSSKNCPLILSPTTQNVEQESQSIPIELKDRKGCNCKKSLCRNNYCECYLVCSRPFSFISIFSANMFSANVLNLSDRLVLDAVVNVDVKDVKIFLARKELYSPNLICCFSEYNMHYESSRTRAINEPERYGSQFQHSDRRDDTSITQDLTSDVNLDVVSLDRRFITPDSSRTNENILSADSVHWPGSVVTPISLFVIGIQEKLFSPSRDLVDGLQYAVMPSELCHDLITADCYRGYVVFESYYLRLRYRVCAYAKQ